MRMDDHLDGHRTFGYDEVRDVVDVLARHDYDIGVALNTRQKAIKAAQYPWSPPKHDNWSVCGRSI